MMYLLIMVAQSSLRFRSVGILIFPARIDSTISLAVSPVKGSLPDTKQYRIHPIAHTSTAGEFPFSSPDSTSGHMYLRVPDLTLGLTF
jgi:hypothetical protein